MSDIVERWRTEQSSLCKMHQIQSYVEELIAEIERLREIEQAARLVRHYPGGWAGMFKTRDIEQRWWERLEDALAAYDTEGE